jgi:hypothetical protein
MVAGVIGLVVISAIHSSRASSAHEEAENKCLVARGLAAAPKVEANSAGAQRAGLSMDQAPDGNCACKEMRRCRGSWERMSCSGLKSLCRSHGEGSAIWNRNNCSDCGNWLNSDVATA